jgi:hypothetical protein
MTYIKNLVTVFAFALIAAGCNSKSVSSVQPAQPTPAPVVTQTTAAPQLQTYTNSTYGFTFQYPLNVAFQTPRYANLNDKIAELGIARADYPNTNFGDAAFSVSASYEKTEAACLAATPPEGGDGFKTQVSVNGTNFYTTKGSGVGAGNIYQTTTYRTFLTLSGSATCLELNETIHTSNIENYPTGTVTAVDTAAVQARLDAILNTFKISGS